MAQWCDDGNDGNSEMVQQCHGAMVQWCDGAMMAMVRTREEKELQQED